MNNNKIIEVSTDPQANWENNAIQFPRLIAEICANVEFKPEHWKDLQESMDLSEDKLNELFDRANDTWENIKLHTSLIKE